MCCVLTGARWCEQKHAALMWLFLFKQPASFFWPEHGPVLSCALCRCTQRRGNVPGGPAGVCAAAAAVALHQPRHRARARPSAARSSRRSSGRRLAARVWRACAAAAGGAPGAGGVPAVLAAAGLVARPCGGTAGQLPTGQHSSRGVCKGGCCSTQSSRWHLWLALCTLCCSMTCSCVQSKSSTQQLQPVAAADLVMPACLVIKNLKRSAWR